MGVVGWCEGVVYLISPGRPTDIGLQLERPAILVAGKGRGGMFYFFCFFTIIPVPLSFLFLSFISSTISSLSFLPFSGRRHKMTHKGWRVVKRQHNQPVILLRILKVNWCMNIIIWDYELVWSNSWPKSKCRSLWPIFHGPVILCYIFKTIWCITIIFWDYVTYIS